MRLRNLVTPSFRNRLRLFFLVIVVVPMIAVAAVLFQTVTRSEEAQTDAQLRQVLDTASILYRESGERASAAGNRIVDNDALQEAIAAGDQERIETRLEAAAKAAGARRVLLALDGPGRFEFG